MMLLTVRYNLYSVHTYLSIYCEDQYVQDSMYMNICTWCSSPSDTTCTIYILIYQYTAKISMYRTLCTWIFVHDAPHRPLQPVQCTMYILIYKYTAKISMYRTLCTWIFNHIFCWKFNLKDEIQFLYYTLGTTLICVLYLGYNFYLCTIPWVQLLSVYYTLGTTPICVLNLGYNSYLCTIPWVQLLSVYYTLGTTPICVLYLGYNF